MKTVCKSGDVDQIVAAAAAELRGAVFVVYCADDARFEEISKKLHKSLPDAKMIGCTGQMLAEREGVEAGISAMGFMENEAEVYVGTLRKIDTCPIKYLPGFIWSVRMIEQKYKDNICIEFTTGHEERVVSTMKVSLEPASMNLVGGTSGNTTPGQEKKVACNGKVLTNSAVYAVIGSKLGKIELYKENLFHTRKQTHIVTKMLDDCRTICELDGRKAMDVYEEENGYTDATAEQGIFKNPLCRMVGAEHYITAIKSFNKSDRSLTTYKNLQKNDMICFTDIDEDYRGFVKQNMNKIASGKKVAGIFSVNCILRYQFFKDTGYLPDYAKLMYDTAGGSHFGMISDGEQYIEQHVNQSMVCAVFTENR